MENPFKDFESESEKISDEAMGEASIYEVQEREREDRWKAKRIGKITSSNLDKLFPLDKTGHMKTKAGLDYILEIKHQVDTGIDENFASVPAMRWGNEYEAEALSYYRKITGINMLSCSNDFDDIVFIDGIIEGFGDSPDGITEDRKGRAEVKCPYNAANHLRNCALTAYHDKCDYWYQILGHLIDPEAEWCDFISYDPRYPDGHVNKMKVIRIWRKDVLANIDQVVVFLKKWIELVKSDDINLIIEEA